MMRKTIFVRWALVTASICSVQFGLAFSQYHASEFRSIAPFYGSRAFNRAGQFSGTDSNGNLVFWSSAGGTQVIGAPPGGRVSSGANQALSELGDAAVEAGGLVSSSLFAYSHTRGWEALPYSPEPDILEVQFYGYSNNDIIAAEGLRNNFPNRIYRYVRVENEWQIQIAPGAGKICSIDRLGNIFYGTGLDIVKPFVWRPDGSRVQLSMGAFADGQVYPLGSDANGRVYGSASRPNGEKALIAWDSLASPPLILLAGGGGVPHLSFVNDFGEVMMSTYFGSTSKTELWSQTDGVVNLQSLITNGGDFGSVGVSLSFNNQRELESYQHGINLPPLFLAPVPEPATLLLMSVGIGFLVARRGKRI